MCIYVYLFGKKNSELKLVLINFSRGKVKTTLESTVGHLKNLWWRSQKKLGKSFRQGLKNIQKSLVREKFSYPASKLRYVEI